MGLYDVLRDIGSRGLPSPRAGDHDGEYRQLQSSSPRAQLLMSPPLPIQSYALAVIVHTIDNILARAGKVKSQTPKVEKTEKPKKPKGRAYKRLLYTRRFINVTLYNGKRRMNPGPSSQ
jgi:small subunit ribosomal protein S30e